MRCGQELPDNQLFAYDHRAFRALYRQQFDASGRASLQRFNALQQPDILTGTRAYQCRELPSRVPGLPPEEIPRLHIVVVQHL